MRSSFWALCFLGLLSISCQPKMLHVQTFYLNRERLASYIVGTPDPLLWYPIAGEQLLIEWNLPENSNYQQLQLRILVRTTDLKQLQHIVPITSLRGSYLFRLRSDGEDPEDCQSSTPRIEAYRVELQADECVRSAVEHQLWSHIIDVGKR